MRLFDDYDEESLEQEIQLREEESPALRPYQVEAVNSVFERWNSGDTATLLCLPTGGGKSVCFSEIMARWVDQCDAS